MYKPSCYHQISISDFNQSCGMQLALDNKWIILAELIDWARIEKMYEQTFAPKHGRPAISLRIALGALIIQKRLKLSDRQVVQAISENPYLQYFIGLKAFTNVCPFKHNSMTSFRKRIDMEMLIKINEIFLESAPPTAEHAKAQGNDGETVTTCIIDATCSPSNISFPQDFVLLDKARMETDVMIDYLHQAFHPWKKPRTYRRVMRKAYLAVAKSKRRTTKVLRALIRRELNSIQRNIGYIEQYAEQGYKLPEKYLKQLKVVRKLYAQQKEMFDAHKHKVSERIVSIDQPHIRPVVRGKAKAKVEFGAKFDVSIDENGYGRLEKAQFEPYNESGVLISVIEAYKKRTGAYPQRVLVDQIYRTRENRRYCQEHGIRMSGPKLGRPPKTGKREITLIEKQDNNDRIEVERYISRIKGCFGAGLIMTKLEETTLAAIALSVFVANIFSLPAGELSIFYFFDSGENYGSIYNIWLEG